MRSIRTLTLALFSVASVAQAPKAGDIVFHLDFNDAKQVAMLKAQGAEIVAGATPCIRISNEKNPEGHMLHLPLDVARLGGSRIYMTARAMTQSVAGTKPGTPQDRYAGVKFQVSYEGKAGHAWHDMGSSGASRNFDWRDMGLIFGMDDGAHDGHINIGLENATGSVCYADLKVAVLRPGVKLTIPADAEAKLTKTRTEYRGVMSPMTFNEQDFKDLQKLNVNLVRWQMNWPKKDMQRDDNWIEPLMETLAKALKAAHENHIKLVVDLHSPPGGRYQDATIRMAMEQKYHDQFIDIWQRLATRFKNNPDIYGFDLINEPVQNRASPPGMSDWLQTEIDAAQAVRKIDQQTPIIFEVDAWDAPESYRWMIVPPVENVIYQVHMYSPGSFTNQGVSTDQGITKDQTMKLGVHYPGLINGKQFGKEDLRTILQPVRNFQLAHNVRIYCGEFSAARWTPGADKWLEDVTSIFEEWGWDYTYHAFREWQGWDLEMEDLPYDHAHGVRSATPTDRMQVMMKRWALNKSTSK